MLGHREGQSALKEKTSTKRAWKGAQLKTWTSEHALLSASCQQDSTWSACQAPIIAQL